jgi:hypothetical protein
MISHYIVCLMEESSLQDGPKLNAQGDILVSPTTSINPLSVFLAHPTAARAMLCDHS